MSDSLGLRYFTAETARKQLNDVNNALAALDAEREILLRLRDGLSKWLDMDHNRGSDLAGFAGLPYDDQPSAEVQP